MEIVNASLINDLCEKMIEQYLGMMSFVLVSEIQFFLLKFI